MRPPSARTCQRRASRRVHFSVRSLPRRVHKPAICVPRRDVRGRKSAPGPSRKIGPKDWAAGTPTARVSWQHPRKRWRKTVNERHATTNSVVFGRRIPVQLGFSTPSSPKTALHKIGSAVFGESRPHPTGIIPFFIPQNHTICHRETGGPGGRCIERPRQHVQAPRRCTSGGLGWQQQKRCCRSA